MGYGNAGVQGDQAHAMDEDSLWHSIWGIIDGAVREVADLSAEPMSGTDVGCESKISNSQ